MISPSTISVKQTVTQTVIGATNFQRIPRTGLILYLGAPNSDEYLVGEATEIGEDTYIWGFYAGTDTTIRAATGWTNGNGNALYDNAGDPIVALASEILADTTMTNQAGGQVFFKSVSVQQQTGKLAIYSAPLSAADEAKLLKWTGVI